MDIPKTYEEFKQISNEELFNLGWSDLSKEDEKRLLGFVKRSMFEHKNKMIQEEKIDYENLTLKDIEK